MAVSKASCSWRWAKAKSLPKAATRSTTTSWYSAVRSVRSWGRIWIRKKVDMLSKPTRSPPGLKDGSWEKMWRTRTEWIKSASEGLALRIPIGSAALAVEGALRVESSSMNLSESLTRIEEYSFEYSRSWFLIFRTTNKCANVSDRTRKLNISKVCSVRIASKLGKEIHLVISFSNISSAVRGCRLSSSICFGDLGGSGFLFLTTPSRSCSSSEE
mmetsp:Transcript_3570/g.6135  ORF Transcript_3570/g.6135 Transcript_3570/m.6135 type:complete len:215 (+) Transcript_3570:1731-2375(+)